MTRVGLYPGSFDPIHNGHTDIIGRAVKLVEQEGSIASYAP